MVNTADEVTFNGSLQDHGEIVQTIARQGAILRRTNSVNRVLLHQSLKSFAQLPVIIQEQIGSEAAVFPLHLLKATPEPLSAGLIRKA